MKLFAKKPCSFGGQSFYIGDEIPENYVSDAKWQEKMGVITIVNDGMGIPGGPSGFLFTQEQVEVMIAEAVEEAEKKREDKLAEMQGHVAELKETESGAYDGKIVIAVKGASDGQYTAIPASVEEIQKVFEIMQMNAEDGARTILDVESESVLILLHAADGRKTIKDAAKRQADKLYPKAILNESGKRK